MSAERSNAPYAVVVDDSPLIVMDACCILERAGFRCADAGNADEAIELLKGMHRLVTLLFTDVEMPGERDGFALARYVTEHWPDIEIVVASGNVRPADDDLPGRATFIPKPFSAETVHGHLRSKLPDGKKPEPLRMFAG